MNPLQQPGSRSFLQTIGLTLQKENRLASTPGLCYRAAADHTATAGPPTTGYLAKSRNIKDVLTAVRASLGIEHPHDAIKHISLASEKAKKKGTTRPEGR